jgi:formate-dependent nitrite reductase cytochrome c552 subunit
VPLSQAQHEPLAARRSTKIWLRGLVVATIIGIATVGISAAMRTMGNSEDNPVTGQDVSARGATPLRRFPVEIRKPSGPPRVVTAVKDAHGGLVTVACTSCHTARPPNHENRSVKEMDEFHGGMAFSHGTVSCLSCHNSNDYDSLKLADGRRVEFTSVMTLCAQCHGPQMKDYEHGVHGGMTGHWDLTRGPRQKNNCVDCHHPHTPQFPKMQPTFKPRDRFLQPPRAEH